MTRTRVWLLALSSFLTLGTASGQTVYTVDASRPAPAIVQGQLKLGTHTDPSGHTLDANNLYFLKDGRPWFPVMGEIHFSRVPREKWEESILKMKAAGISVIASYVFWIYHEEIEGQFDWSGNKDLRYFAELCKKHDVFFFVRIGPWCHGEVRNGGFPDWIVKRGNTRRNDPAYLASVQTLYGEIGKQLNGLYYKNGGPVVGVQVENEFRFNNPNGLQHMLTLKQEAIKAGIDVPFYTATGWPGSDQKQNELVPVWGAYPEAPWDKKTTRLPLSENYLFTTLRNDPAIGSDLLGQHQQDSDAGYRYPYATAEMGGGNQITYHRRPIIAPQDVTALTYVKTGSGANLMGYYMFHGGSNPIGKLSTLQESKATKYPNDYQLINYDFQAPIGEWGELQNGYRGFKLAHLFLADFGDRLVQDYPAFPDRKPSSTADDATLRFAVRADAKGGFVFISRFQRQLQVKDVPDVRFDVKLPHETVRFPQRPIHIPAGLQAVLPFRFDMDGVMLDYATTQPVCRLDTPTPTYIFFAPTGLRPEYAIAGDKGMTVTARNGKVTGTAASGFTVADLSPGLACGITVTKPGGKRITIITLTYQQALDGWKGTIGGKNYFFVSGQELEFPGPGLIIESEGQPELRLAALPALPGALLAAQKRTAKAEGYFTSYAFSLPPVKLDTHATETNDINDYMNKGPLLPADNRDAAMNVPASPGPRYQTNLMPVNGSKYYALSVPRLPANLTEAYLRIRYVGDTGSAYRDGKLVADDFYYGKPMTVGLREIFGDAGGRLLLQIVALTDERKIFFEDGIREPLSGKTAADLLSVTITPKYRLSLMP